jgi:chromosome segregation ATPase
MLQVEAMQRERERMQSNISEMSAEREAAEAEGACVQERLALLHERSQALGALVQAGETQLETALTALQGTLDPLAGLLQALEAHLQEAMRDAAQQVDAMSGALHLLVATAERAQQAIEQQVWQ